jgi:hypothetical protein
MNSTIRLLNESGSGPLFQGFVESVSIFEFFFINCFTVPLLIIYFHGPEIYNIGFWNGRSNIDICTRVTNLTPEFWLNLPDQCDRVVHDKFITFCQQCSYTVWIIWVFYATLHLFWLAQSFLDLLIYKTVQSFKLIYSNVITLLFTPCQYMLKASGKPDGKISGNAAKRFKKKQNRRRITRASPSYNSVQKEPVTPPVLSSRLSSNNKV